MRKQRKIFNEGMTYYRKKRYLLPEREKKELENILESLDQAILQKNKEQSMRLSSNLQAFLKTHHTKTFWDKSKEIVSAILFAIIVAFLVRQFWFELYEVPTGSMRPTIEELDRLVVSKTTFGLHLPFTEKTFFFSPDRILRNGMIVFSAKGLDILDARMVYFYLFPGYKQFIKRCLGKPGDTLYFYGGRIYGIDKDGHPITELYDEKNLQKLGLSLIDHIPVISFDGKFELANPLPNGLFREATLLQMNEPVGKLSLDRTGKIRGTFYNGQNWVLDNPAALKKEHSFPQSFSDLWGIRNYAMCRLLSLGELKSYVTESVSAPSQNAPLLYLELRHTPNMSYPFPEIRRDELGKIHPMPTPYTAVIPLYKEHLERIQKALFTARFTIKNNKAYRYQKGGGRPQPADFDPTFFGVPDGTYEFYYGKGYKVYFGGILAPLKEDHPLYNSSPENIQKLFNLGIAFNLLFSPFATNQPFNPQRFAYFREGDFYVMGAPIMTKEDPILLEFIQSEIQKQESSSSEAPYIAFLDRGPPLKQDGSIDTQFISNFGLKIPENGLLALGDNYAMSADSRDFGFVPLSRLRGAPLFTFWPPEKRFGPLPQNPYPWITLPNIIVSVIVIVIIFLIFTYFYKKRRSSQFKKLK